jgi:RNA polymerase sigma-70 factor (ECF subfamily)
VPIIHAGESTTRQTIDFDQFFREQHQRLIACGLALSGDRERAREAAQEALSRAYRDWDHVCTLANPPAWVRRVLINVIIDAGRRQKRERDFVARTGSLPVAPEVDPTRTALLRAIRALPERQRIAVTLHYLDDLSVTDVADVMQIAEGTVKATLFKARASLAAALKEDES